jgi:predicted anti-sigma-YlaC factor YlaD
MKKTCNDIQEMLVDYADGLLGQAESKEVVHHLAECDDCRKLLAVLQKSLECAKIVWEDGLNEAQAIKTPGIPKTFKVHWLRYAAVAASIMIITAVSVLWCSSNKPKEKPPELSFEEIEKNINDAGDAARLLAATQLLANSPQDKEFVEQQYRNIVERYPKTSVAERMKSKIQ